MLNQLQDNLYMVFELLERGEVLEIPAEKPLTEEEAWWAIVTIICHDIRNLSSSSLSVLSSSSIMKRRPDIVLKMMMCRKKIQFCFFCFLFSSKPPLRCVVLVSRFWTHERNFTYLQFLSRCKHAKVLIAKARKDFLLKRSAAPLKYSFKLNSKKFSTHKLAACHHDQCDDQCHQEELPRRAAGPGVPPLPEDHPQRHQTKQPTQVPLIHQ